MSKLTAAQKRFLENAALNIASQLIFRKLEEAKFPVKRLGDICTVCRGGSPRPKGDPKYFGGYIPWIMIADASNSPDRYINSTRETVTEEGAKRSRLLKAGTLIVTNSATIGLPKILGVDGCIHDGFLAFLDLSPDVERDFLYCFFLNIRTHLERIAPEGTQKNINTNIARLLELPVPPPKLQKAICKFLEVAERRQKGERRENLPDLPSPVSDVKRIVARVEELSGKIEEARSLRQKSIEQTEAILGSELSALFNYANSNQIEFKNIGNFTIYDRYGPRFYNEVYSEHGVPIMRATDIDDGGGVNYKSMPKMAVSAEDKEKLTLKPGDLVVVRSGSVGRSAVFDRDDIHCIPSAYMIQFRFDESVISHYVRYWFQAPLIRDKLKGRGTALKNINAEKIKSIKIPIPPISEQRRIVTYLDRLQTKVDEMKRMREQAIKELDALLPSILDKAFKGEL